MNLRRILQLSALFTAGVLQLGASCSSSEPRYDPYPPPPPNRPGGGYGGGGYGGGYPGGGGGGDWERPRRIPRNSDVVRDGTDRLRWTADFNGEIYVYDPGADRVVYNGPIRRGQEIIVNPEDDLIWIDNRKVVTSGVRKDGRHQIYFVREGRPVDNRPPPPPPRGDAPPRGARRLDTGAGSVDIDRAPANGTIYVYDEVDRRVVFEAQIARGENFQINPQTDSVVINGRRVGTVRLNNQHRHSLYFRDR